MPDGQIGDSGYSVEEEGDFFSDAELTLSVAVALTENVTLLKKIYSSGFLMSKAFDRLLFLMNKGNPEASLEVMNICSTSKAAQGRVNKMGDYVVKN